MPSNNNDNYITLFHDYESDLDELYSGLITKINDKNAKGDIQEAAQIMKNWQTELDYVGLKQDPNSLRFTTLPACDFNAQYKALESFVDNACRSRPKP